MLKHIISDTSCFILLSKIDELDILKKVYGEIFTTPEVAAEFGEPLPGWVKIISSTDKNLQLLLELQIDKGEASALALALEKIKKTDFRITEEIEKEILLLVKE